MAKPPINRTAFAGAGGGSNLANFAAPSAPPASAPLVAAPAVAPEPDDDLRDLDDVLDDGDTDEVRPAPAAKKRKPRARSATVVPKSFPMTASFVAELQEARKNWHLQDPSRIDHFSGMASENAFIQALARLAMERIAVNAKDAQRLMKFFPENTRTR